MWVPGLMSMGQGVGPRSNVQGEGPCTVRSNASMVMVTWDPLWMDSHTPVKALPFHNFVGGR